MALEHERQRYANLLEHVVNALPKALAQLPEIERAWLFGSYVRGRRDLCTDLDLIVVMRSSNDFVTRTARLYRRLAELVPIAVDLDLFVYTPEEWGHQQERVFWREALSEGRLIYERAD